MKHPKYLRYHWKLGIFEFHLYILGNRIRIDFNIIYGWDK